MKSTCLLLHCEHLSRLRGRLVDLCRQSRTQTTSRTT
jgi:hypothetical protein